MTESASTSGNEITKWKSARDKVKEYSRVLASGDFWYQVEKWASAYDLLLSKYARFRPGDRVCLARTPVINMETAPGWYECAHFLIEGAIATAVTVDVRGQRILYGLRFKSESWIDGAGRRNFVDPERLHVFTFAEEDLVPPVDTTTVKCCGCGRMVDSQHAYCADKRGRNDNLIELYLRETCYIESAGESND